MEIEILDEILNYLIYIQNSKKPYVVGSNEKDHYFLKYNDDFFKSAINKLIKDGYLTLGTNVSINFVSKNKIAGLCNITFEGILFIKSGGYQNYYSEIQRKENAYDDLQTEQRKQSIALVNLNRWLVFGAIIVAIDSILNILNFFGISFCFLKSLLLK